MDLRSGTGEHEKDSTEDPNSAVNYEEIFQWNAKLKEALRFEDYETAAVCRDKIKELKKGNEADA